MSIVSPVPLPWPPTDVDIAASLLSADPLALLSEAQALHRAGVDWLHVDVMDGHFVPNLGLMPSTAAQLVARQPLPLDVHLMVEDPGVLIDMLAQAGVSVITVHAEVSRGLQRTLSRIRRQGVRVGLALAPATPLGVLFEVAHLLDVVLLMSVEPGFSGQTFLPSTLDKLERARTLLEQRAPGVVLAVDGGIEAQHAYELCRRGARMLVAGQALAGARQRQEALEGLRSAGQRGLSEFYRRDGQGAQGMEGGQSL